MSGLAGRIAARLDALEAGARGATPGDWKLWGMQVLADQDGTSNVDTAVPVASTHFRNEAGKPRTFDAAHIAAWDPAAVLRLVDGLRAVVGLHGGDHVCPSGNGPGCTDYDADGDDAGMEPCPTLLGIAAALGVEVGE